ncbi:NADH-ubiquinone oxidoreductase subunit [Xylaria sp. CBS 124048]|nr:NADH-ubiquinone oxidoreductase subunit [Xylaria sp. CBS 124048]
MPQDMPPVGGYGPVQYKRNLPANGFRPGAWLLAMGVVMTYGFYKLGQGVKEQKELAREKMWSRIHLIPLLQAEEDRDLVRRHLADQAREKELLGENIKVYNSDRYVRPTYAVTPANVTK